MPTKLAVVAALTLLSVGGVAAEKMTTEELDALARDFGYSRMGVGAWEPPPPPSAETVPAVVRVD